MQTTKIKVIYFQRKPRYGFNFSLEQIFEDIRERLEAKIIATVEISRFYNDGYLSKFGNILQAALKQGKGVNHVTGEVHFLNLLMKRKTVLLTILDCRFMERKKGIQKKLINLLYLKLPVKKAKYITTISSDAKAEIIKYTNCNPDKILVIPIAVNKIYQPFAKSFCADFPTILQIGTAENKNIERVIIALKNIPCKLVLIGKLSPNQIALLNTHNICYENYYNLTQQELLQHYRLCDIVSFASTYEGFGMPIIEANCIERAVLTSNISSMPEVAGSAASLVDPYNINSIRSGFLEIINNDLFREEIIANGRSNRLRFDGQIIANSYYELYKKIGPIHTIN